MRILLTCTVAVLLSFCTSSAKADIVLFDSLGFENYTLGNLVGQFGWDQDGDANYEIQSDVSVSGNALRVSRGAIDNVDWAFPSSLNFTPSSGQTVTITADIARTISETTPSFGFAIDVFTPGFARITRFGLVANGGQIQGFYTSLNNDNIATNFLTSSATYAENEFVSFAAVLDFDLQAVNLFVNGVSVTGSTSIAFANINTLTTLGSAEFQISSNATATDVGYLDNFRVTAIPEPNAGLILSVFGIVIAFRRRVA